MHDRRGGTGLVYTAPAGIRWLAESCALWCACRPSQCPPERCSRGPRSSCSKLPPGLWRAAAAVVVAVSLTLARLRTLIAHSHGRHAHSTQPWHTPIACRSVAVQALTHCAYPPVRLCWLAHRSRPRQPQPPPHSIRAHTARDPPPARGRSYGPQITSAVGGAAGTTHPSSSNIFPSGFFLRCGGTCTRTCQQLRGLLRSAEGW